MTEPPRDFPSAPRVPQCRHEQAGYLCILDRGHSGAHAFGTDQFTAAEFFQQRASSEGQGAAPVLSPEHVAQSRANARDRVYTSDDMRRVLMILADSHESLRAALDAARQRDDEGYRRMMTWALDTLAMQCERLILLGDPEHLVYSPRYLAAVEKARTIARLGEASSDTR